LAILLLSILLTLADRIAADPKAGYDELAIRRHLPLRASQV
jgi:hypothetical protein